LDGGFELDLGFAQVVALVGGWCEFVVYGTQAVESEKIEHGPASPASVPIASDREEPGGQIGVVVQPVSIAREGQPGVLEQVLGDGGISAES